MHSSLHNALAPIVVLALSAPAAAQFTLIAHYRLDETSGTVCVDSSGNNNDGTYVGGVTLGQPGVAATSATSVDFDGIDGHVEIPNSASLDGLLNDFTVAAWMNADVLNLMRIFGNQRPAGPGTGGSWSYGIFAGNIRFTTLDLQDYNQPANVQQGVWQHVAVSVDAQNDATFYLDGVNVGTIVGNSPMANNPAPGYLIGALDLVLLNEWFDGRIDDVQVYDGAMGDADVLFLFNNPGQVGGTGPIGTSYCSPAIPNSSGNAAVISADGSITIANNDVTLTASLLPAGQFGYFLAGQTQGFFNPPGSQGIICLAGNIGRYNQVANIIQGPTGSIAVNLMAIPVNPPAAVQSGQTWNFQCWFRDNNPTLTSNFTDGVSITFQ